MHSTNPSVDIRPDQLAIVQGILSRHLSPDVKVWVFGSRATWTTKDSSDLDLALEGRTKIDHKTMGALATAFQDSILPYSVDVVDLKQVSGSFKEVVAAQKVLVLSSARHERWSAKTLGQLVTLSNGRTSPVRSNGLPHPVYGSNGIIGFSDQTNATENTIIIGRVGTYCGSLQYSERACWVTDNAIRANAAEENDSRFLFYLLHSLRLNEWRSGSGQPLLNQTILSSIPTHVPPLSEQRAIAHILGTLDDKIELNRRMNQTLEELTRAMFKDWFIDFGPTRAKMEGRKPYLPADVWDLFPDNLVVSELGLIPNGWAVRELRDCVNAERGLSYKGSGLSSSGVPMHNLNSIYEGGGYKDEGIKYYIGDYQPRHVTWPGDVLVANTEQGHRRLLIGFAAIVPKRFGDHGLYSHHIYRVRPKNSSGLTTDFICQLLNTRAMQGTISGYATGTTVNMLPADSLRITLIVVPPPQLVTTFSSIAAAARIRQEHLIAESRSLTAQRDVLLPKLVSGAMRVSMNAEQSESPRW